MNPSPSIVLFNGYLWESEVNALISKMNQLHASGVTHVKLLISSHGGHFNQAWRAYNEIERLGMIIDTHNLNYVESNAIILFLAGRKRTSEENATFLIHGQSIEIGSETYNRNSLNLKLKTSSNPAFVEGLSKLNLVQPEIDGLILVKTKITKLELDSLNSSEPTISSDEARILGIISRTVDSRELISDPLIHKVCF